MVQIPAIDWPRRSSQLTGLEDLLKQNPSSDASPQEERIPVDLVSQYTASKLILGSVGTGVSVVHSQSGYNLNFRPIIAASNKVSVDLSNNVINIDVNVANIGNQIKLSDLSDVADPTNINQYLTWNGSSFIFTDNIIPTFYVKDQYNTVETISQNQTLKLRGGGNGISIIRSDPKEFTIFFTGGLKNLSDTGIGNSITHGHVLTYNGLTTKWEPKSVNIPTTLSFYIKGDDPTTDTISDSQTFTILGGTNLNSIITGGKSITLNWSAELDDLNNVYVTSPLNGQVLTYSTSNGQWEAKSLPPINTYSAQNGITLDNNIIEVGGQLLKNTTIYGNSYYFDILGLSEYHITTTKTNHEFRFESNIDIGSTRLVAKNTTSLDEFALDINSAMNKICFEVKILNTANRFKTLTTTTGSAIFYEENNVSKSGFFVEQDKIKILDGVTTPSAGHVLTYMANGTAQFQPSSGGGGGIGDDWGTQYVITNNTLNGQGTLASPLNVTNPLPPIGNNGDILFVSNGEAVWTASGSTRELICINEIERNSEVSIIDGKLFVAIPPELNGWKIKSLTGVVSTVGSGGTTTFVLKRNDIIINSSTTSISDQYSSTTNIEEIVYLGDRISVAVTGVKTTKDKGLSITIILKSS